MHCHVPVSLKDDGSDDRSGIMARRLVRRRYAGDGSLPPALPFTTGHLIADRTSYLGVKPTGWTTVRTLARRKFECLPVAKSLYFLSRRCNDVELVLTSSLS